MKSRFNGAGYLLSDNTASDWGTKEEADILSCGHCQALIKKSDWKEDGCWCSCCDQAVGVTCGCAKRMLTRGCENFLMKLEKAIERKYTVDQNARILGTRDII